MPPTGPRVPGDAPVQRVLRRSVTIPAFAGAFVGWAALLPLLLPLALARDLLLRRRLAATRTVVAVLAFLFVAAPAGTANAQSAAADDEPRHRMAGGTAAATDPLNTEQLALRLATLFERTAELLRAEARGAEREYV